MGCGSNNTHNKYFYMMVWNKIIYNKMVYNMLGRKQASSGTKHAGRKQASSGTKNAGCKWVARRGQPSENKMCYKTSRTR